MAKVFTCFCCWRSGNDFNKGTLTQVDDKVGHSYKVSLTDWVSTHPDLLNIIMLQVFWDIENCFLNDSRTQPSMGSSEWNRRRMLDPQQHFDLLSDVFMTHCGVSPREFRIHAVYSQLSMKALDQDVRLSLQAMHPHVNLMNPLGRWPVLAVGNWFTTVNSKSTCSGSTLCSDTFAVQAYAGMLM